MPRFCASIRLVQAKMVANGGEAQRLPPLSPEKMLPRSKTVLRWMWASVAVRDGVLATEPQSMKKRGQMELLAR
jgi:hypothetical protein